MIRRLPKKPKRAPWIPPRKRVDHSRMDSCPEAEERTQALLSRGCLVSGRKHRIQIHHIRQGVGKGMRAPWWETIPLFEEYHDPRFPYSTHGRDRARFHQDHGTERELLERVNARLPSRLRRPT